MIKNFMMKKWMKNNNLKKAIELSKQQPKKEDIKDNEIRITSTGKTRNYISYATALFNEKKHETIVLKAMGRAISKTVTIGEIIKRRVVGLHQLTEITSNQITDQKDGKEIKRNVSAIIITLSTKTLDVKNAGYQKPIPESEVKPQEKHNYEDDDEKRERPPRRENNNNNNKNENYKKSGNDERGPRKSGGDRTEKKQHTTTNTTGGDEKKQTEKPKTPQGDKKKN